MTSKCFGTAARAITVALLGVFFMVNTPAADEIDTDLIGGLLACEALRPIVRTLPREPLYQITGGACRSTGTLGGARYTDADCTLEIDTGVMEFDAYCESVTAPGVLGDARALPPHVDRWDSTPGTRVPLTLPGLSDSSEPFVGRANYRTVSRDGDDCALEMRVYRAHPGAQNQPPVIAFHGGSWSSRRAGFPGMESLIAHFTDRGMVVFAPFYRLAGAEDGPTACQGWVAEDIVDDAEAALEWVSEHGARYGAGPGQPVVFGQSAGAFLAAWLAVERSTDVAAALLMYPPVDVGDFADQVSAGRYTNPDGIRILARFIGQDASEWLPASARFARLSLATRVAEGESVAPLRLVHGLEDDLVLPRQAELLCAAAESRVAWQAVVEREAPAERNLTLTRRCGASGQLSLLSGAQHALEVCVPGVACQAGNLLQAVLASDVLIDAYDWVSDSGYAAQDAALAEQPVEPPDTTPPEEAPEDAPDENNPDDGTPSDDDTSQVGDTDTVGGESGGGAVIWGILGVFAMRSRRCLGGRCPRR